MHESPRTSSASTDEVSQVTRLARWAWTLRAQHNAKRRVARVCALDGWSWAGHRVHHVVWVVQGIEHATSGGSGGGVKMKELMDSSMTLAQTGTNMAREFPYWEHVMSDEGILVRQKISKAIWSYKTTGDLFSFAFEFTLLSMAG
ncbi:hypothetical protein C8J57DRAFT_1237782 [Mycena rebaudengoi]|nr:hypothetical protein C8J57DRAFT_1237782 [Mycena rebaudengoi]